jgi:hypothetical protein
VKRSKRSAAADPDVAAEVPVRSGRRRLPIVLAVVAAGWFAATLWLAHNGVVAAPDPQSALVTAALSVPLILGAAAVAGAAVAGPVAARARRLRSVVGAGVGAALGALGGGALLLIYGTVPAFVALAVTIAVSAALGGALTGVPLPAIAMAGVTGALVWFAVGLVEGVFSGALSSLFGSRESAAGQLAAAGRMSFTVALLGGGAAGLGAYLVLRRHSPGPGWPAFLAAGGLPGAVLVVADVGTRVGGGPLIRLARRTGLADQIALEYVAANRLSTAFVVLFAGAIVTLILHGRTLKPANR